MRPISSPDVVFWRHVTPSEDGCWLWQGARTGTGYGHTRVGGRHGRYVTSNRLSWEVHFGPIPDGANVLHHCDVKTCARPTHLYLGSKSDNARDALLRLTHPGRKLTPTTVRRIRADRAAGVRPGVLARQYGVGTGAISDAVSGRSWRHVA